MAGATILLATCLLGTTGSPAAAATPAEAVTIVARGISFPGAITAASDGNLWFTNANNSIGRITPAGVLSMFGGPGIDDPAAITSGPDGNLWFTNNGGDSIGRITTSGAVSSFGAAGLNSPDAITAGPDGNLWFTASGSIGRIMPAGSITLHPGIGAGGSRGITTGPDGNLWFTSTDSSSIGRITPAGVVTTFADPAISGAEGITAGPDGNLWFTNTGNGSIGRITPVGGISSFTLPGGAQPIGIASGADGNLWFTNRSHDTIGRITTAGVVSIFADASVAGPRGITSAPDGNLWFTNGFGHSIGRITPAGVISEVTPPGIDVPFDIVAGPDGNMWFPNHDGGSIGRVTPAGAVTTFADPSIDEPYGIAAGPDGNLWFTNRGNSSIGRITPAGVVASFTDPGVSSPQRITAGPDGNLWFTNQASSSIGRITTAGVISTITDPGIVSPDGIAAGPDGNLWFTNSTSIGRITPGGVVSTFTGPGSGGSDITAGPDGNLWFANQGAGSIGRISTAGMISRFDDPAIRDPEAITAGPDGDLWFANNTLGAALGSIGRLTPSGVVSTFSRTDMSPTAVAAGPDGNVWFASRGSVIGFVTTGLAGAPGGVVATGRTGEATVTWTAPADHGGSPITGYTVTATPGGQTCAWTSGPLSCTVTGLSSGPHTFSVVATTAAGPGGASPPSIPVHIPAGVALHPLTPTRILDSRPAGPQVGPYGTPWDPGAVRDVTVAGAGVVPAAAEAVVLNVTVTDTTAAGYLTIWPAGQPRPIASSLNWAPGPTVANAATVKVGAGGKVSILNPVGHAHVILDIVGYYDDTPMGDGYTTLTPARILDSRPAGPQVGPYATPWGPGQTRDVAVAGVGGVAGADAVVVNVTVTGATAAGYLTIWPAGQAQPLASSLNWAPGQTVANAVTVKVGDGGKVSVRNATGRAHVVVDVVGSFAPLTGSLFHPLAPARIQDSRTAGPQVGPFGTPWGPNATRTVQVTGARGVPAGAAAALLNITATRTSAFSYLTVAPAGEAPLASSLNWQAGQTVSNAVPAKLSPTGAISVKNAAGVVDIIADVAGWYG